MHQRLEVTLLWYILVYLSHLFSYCFVYFLVVHVWCLCLNANLFALIRETWLPQRKRWDLNQNKITSCLLAIQIERHQTDNCKMVYWLFRQGCAKSTVFRIFTEVKTYLWIIYAKFHQILFQTRGNTRPQTWHVSTKRCYFFGQTAIGRFP